MNELNFNVTFGIDRLPDSRLTPNNLRRTHWAVRAKYEKLARQEMYLLACTNRPSGWIAPERCWIQYQFIVKSKRERDLDGLISAAKPWLDALVDSGILSCDDGFHVAIRAPLLIIGEYEETRITIERIN